MNRKRFISVRGGTEKKLPPPQKLIVNSIYFFTIRELFSQNVGGF